MHVRIFEFCLLFVVCFKCVIKILLQILNINKKLFQLNQFLDKACILRLLLLSNANNFLEFESVLIISFQNFINCEVQHNNASFACKLL